MPSIRSRLSIALAAAVLWAAVILPTWAFADTEPEGHLPIINPVLSTSFSTTANGFGPKGDPFSPNGSLANGSWQVTGSVTLPIARGISASYEKLDPALVNASLQGVALPFGPPNAYAYPGSSRDLLQRYHIDGHIRHVNLALGFASRTRLCCPASNDPHNPASFEWHQGYATITYIAAPIKELGGTTFIASLTGLTAKHNPSPGDLAQIPPGLNTREKRWYATTQVVSAVVPLGNRRSRANVSGTFIWGAFDTYENAAFPWYYDTWIFAFNKQFTPNFSLSLRNAIGTQRVQGDPEPGRNVIRGSTIVLLAGFHFDLNTLLAPHARGAERTQ